MAIEYTLEAVNRRLKACRVGVTISRRGGRLILRATLPPRKGNGKWKQQTISCGFRDSPIGLQAAEKESHGTHKI